MAREIPSTSSDLSFAPLIEGNKAIMKEIMRKRSSKQSQSNKFKVDYLSYLLLGFVLFITIATYPYQTEGKVTLQHVWYSGWMTAVATGAGVIPFFFISQPNKFWMGVSNAVAGGMMIAASLSLFTEAVNFQEEDFGILAMFPGIDAQIHSMLRAAVGVVLGLVFIVGMKKVLDRYEDLDETQLLEGGASTQKMILIIVVMTLHSLSEGIGIGVSFGGSSGMKLGQFISLSLAVHNIPEGLAVALVLTSRKMSNIRTVLWAIFTSLPQPIFAIPAYLFVENFVPLLPAGLGFAAGAMFYVAIFELLMEAAEDTSITVTGIAGCISFFTMNFLQEAVKHSV
eukprot:gene84-88_t